MTNNKLADTEIAEILSGVVDGVQPTTHEIAMASELQVYRKASKEPVITDSAEIITDNSALITDNQPAPPLQAVPDAYMRDEQGRMMLNGKSEPRIGYADGWNACRAAMLAAAPQPSNNN